MHCNALQWNATHLKQEEEGGRREEAGGRTTPEGAEKILLHSYSPRGDACGGGQKYSAPARLATWQRRRRAENTLLHSTRHVAMPAGRAKYSARLATWQRRRRAEKNTAPLYSSRGDACWANKHIQLDSPRDDAGAAEKILLHSTRHVATPAGRLVPEEGGRREEGGRKEEGGR